MLRESLLPRSGVSSLAAFFLLQVPAIADASHSCPTPQPPFAYVDVDNDGCHTDAVDSTSIDAQLQAATTMANVPSFVAPPGTGLVLPSSLVLPDDADPFWSVPNDVWIDGQVSGPAGLRIEAGGTTYVNGSIRLKAKGFSDDADLRLGCAAGCGPTVLDDGVRLGNNGLLAIYDVAIGNDVRITVRCEPGGVPSCGGQSFFARATAIGSGFRLDSPGGIHFEEGVSPLTIGDGARFTTKAVSTDGGTLGFPISMELAAGVTFGSDARLRAGGSMTVQGGESSFPLTGPVGFGAGARLGASTLVVRGSSLGFGSGSDLRGRRDIMVSGQLSSVILRAADGPLTLGADTSIAAGRMYLDAGTGLLDAGAGTRLSTSGASQEIELTGAQIVVSPGAELSKSTSDLTPILIAADSSVSVLSSSIRGAGLNVSVSQAAATISFTGNDVNGEDGRTAVFTAPGGGVCDLSGSTFGKLGIDTTGCGSVVGP